MFNANDYSNEELLRAEITATAGRDISESEMEQLVKIGIEEIEVHGANTAEASRAALGKTEYPMSQNDFGEFMKRRGLQRWDLIADYIIMLEKAKASFEQKMFGRDEFMEFFRNDRFHEEMSPEDCKEMFSQVLHGSSDFSKELLDQTLGDYELGVLSLYSNEDLIKELKERGMLIPDDKPSVVTHRVEKLKKQIEDIDKRHKGQEQKLTYHAGFDNGYLKGKLAAYEDLFEFDSTNKSKMESEINNYPPVEVHLTSFYKTGVNGISTRPYSTRVYNAVDEIDLSDKYLFTMKSDFSNSLVDRLVNIYQNDPKIHINKTLQLHFEDSAMAAGRKFEVVNETLAEAVGEIQKMNLKNPTQQLG